jgi:multicomponent Na+:H+ antiporter subunit F
MNAVTSISAVLLAIATVPALIRMVRGPSVADRMVALDTLLFIGVGGAGVYIVRTGDTTFIPIVVVAVVTAFLGTVVVARYIEAETER